MRSDVSLVKKTNVERYFTGNYSTFAEKFPAGDARKAAVAELKLKAEQSKQVSLRFHLFHIF